MTIALKISQHRYPEMSSRSKREQSCNSWLLEGNRVLPQPKPSPVKSKQHSEGTMFGDFFSGDFLSAFCLANPKPSNLPNNTCVDYRGKWVVFKVNHPVSSDNKLGDYDGLLVDDLKMYVSGSVPRLGSWNIELAAPMTYHTKPQVGSWWELLFMLPSEIFFSYTYVLKDSHGGVVWKSPLVRRYATKCATILDIVTLDEIQNYAPDSESDSASYKVHSNGLENKSIAADFVVIDSENSVARASSREISTGSVRRDQGHPSLMSFGDSASELPVKTIYL
jgi:hypothetical protein